MLETSGVTPNLIPFVNSLIAYVQAGNYWAVLVLVSPYVAAAWRLLVAKDSFFHTKAGGVAIVIATTLGSGVLSVAQAVFQHSATWQTALIAALATAAGAFIGQLNPSGQALQQKIEDHRRTIADLRAKIAAMVPLH